MARLVTGLNDLATVNPDLAAEWHPAKNAPLLPSQVAAGTKKKVWWKCHLGHEWEAAVSSRNKGSGCPYCAGQRAIPGVNDLSTVSPGLAAEWHPSKNGPLCPNQIMPKSSKKVWWLGKCGHEWEAVVSSRTAGSACPYCSGHKLLPGYNDLATVDSELATEWHPTKNGDLHADQVTAHCARKVWWMGKCGHEWQATVAVRESGHGCPFCSGGKTLKGFNDLATVNSKLAAEWHPTKNGDLSPTQITAGTSKKVWWMCSEGHEWEAAVSSRNKGSGCPYCSEKRAITGINDLATINPKLAAEWHPTKNGNLSPNQVTAGSGKKVWWVCTKCGNEWKAVISNRSHGSNCPLCSHPHDKKSNRQFLEELAAVNSKIVPLEPYIDNKTKILVRCGECGYEWKVAPGAILDNPNRCPRCWESRRGLSRVKSNEEFLAELAEVNPFVAPLEPYVSSKEKIRCRCEICGHEWLVSPNELLRGNGCPSCNHSQTSYVEQCIYLAFQARLGDSAVLSRDRVAIGSELDVYVPEKSLAVEYGAWHWHRNRIEGDRKKANLCKSRGIRLIEIYDAFPKDEVEPYGMECLTFHSPLSLAKNRKELHVLLNLLLECAESTALSIDEFTEVSTEAHRHSRQKTTEDFIAELAAVTSTIEVLGEYRGRDCKIKVRCETCSHEWSARAGNLLSGYGCPNCKALNHSLRSRKTHDQFVRELSLCNPSVEALGRYVTNKKKVLVRGKSCGHEWQASPTHLLNGSGCPVCAGRHQGIVVCLETGVEYKNYNQAAHAVGLTGSAGVKDSCMNPNRTAGGFHWWLKDY